MASSRFNDGGRRRAVSGSAPPGYSQWIRTSKLGDPSGLATPGQKRIFAIVSPPIPTPVGGKTMRRIVIFDNHPDSLRLVLQSGFDPDSDDAASRRERRTAIT